MSNQRTAKLFYFDAKGTGAFWLRSMMHHCRDWLCSVIRTAKFYENFCWLDSMVWCTRWSFLKRKFAFLTSWCAWYHRVWSRGVMHTAEFLTIKIQNSWRNWKKKYFTQFVRGPCGMDGWKKGESKISWHTPSKGYHLACLHLNWTLVKECPVRQNSFLCF